MYIKLCIKCSLFVPVSFMIFRIERVKTVDWCEVLFRLSVREWDKKRKKKIEVVYFDEKGTPSVHYEEKEEEKKIE